MGEGLYFGIGFGCLVQRTSTWFEVVPPHKNSEDLDWHVADLLNDFRFDEALEGIGLQMATEAKPDYLLIPLAVTEEARVWRGRVEQLPIYRAIPLDELVASWLAVISPDNLAKAQQQWEQVRRTATAYGFTLPERKLICISDWD